MLIYHSILKKKKRVIYFKKKKRKVRKASTGNRTRVDDCRSDGCASETPRELISHKAYDEYFKTSRNVFLYK